MTSKMFGTPKMIVPYEWIFETVEEEPMTIASKMILFRGEKVFRVGLKNHAESPILFLMAIDLSKIGIRAEDVKYGIQGSELGPATMTQMTNENIDDKDGSLQLFTSLLDKKIVGSCTFAFQIAVEGPVFGYYSYQLSDRLAEDQLWAAFKNQLWTDVELIVKDKIFPVHKAILAARSYIFASEFEKLSFLPVKDGPHQIRIDGVDPSTVEKFLYFVYTGETMGTLADEELLKLANQYGLRCLSRLCRAALKKIEVTQVIKLMDILNSGVEGLHSSKITPEKETEIFFDRTAPTFRCESKFYRYEIENGKSKCLMQYQDEDVFFVHFTGHCNSDSRIIGKPVIHFACAKHRKFGCEVEDIYCRLKGQNQWFKMEPKKLKNNAELLQHFTFEWNLDLQCNINHLFEFNFDIKTGSANSSYCYEMMDNAWPTDFWLAATNQKLTDVEICVGTVKLMEAHRVILSARSPVLNILLNKISNTGKSVVTFGAEFDVEIIKNFLNFLYTGSLKSTDGVHQLSQLATMYDVETLKSVCQPCQLFDANSMDGMDVEELTDYLLQL